MQSDDPAENGQWMTERLILVLDVTTDGCGVTRAMRNHGLYSAKQAIEAFNLVLHVTTVRTEVDGAAVIDF